jgi:hypothetical protein
MKKNNRFFYISVLFDLDYSVFLFNSLQNYYSLFSHALLRKSEVPSRILYTNAWSLL